LDLQKLWQLATPILEKNDFGISHTQRVYNLAKQNFPAQYPLEDLTYASIILHDIGGCSIKDQYEKGPLIATELLQQVGCSASFIRQVCHIIATHHDHPDYPSEPFKSLYDADKLVMFTAEEYPTYNGREGFDWEKIISLIYTQKGKELAREMLAQRRAEQE
jgi:hypothetical protein